MNEGWEWLVSKFSDDEYFLRQFAKRFCAWEREAILLTEWTYAEDYVYVTAVGVFSNIGTLARAIQMGIHKDWELGAAQLIGAELHLHFNTGIAGASHRLRCQYVELDQAHSTKHHEGWKFNRRQ